VEVSYQEVTMNKTSEISSVSLPAEPYGRIELKKSLQRNWIKGFLISVTIHFMVFGLYYALTYLSAEEDIPTVTVRVMKYSDLGPPPSIAPAPLAPSVNVATAAKPSIGVPVPVPDAEVSPEQTIATQTELSSTPSPALEELGEGGGNVEITQDIVIESDPGIDEFVPVEKPPQIVQKVVPKYPEMAMRAGIEGTVWVKILVGKDGKPQKAVVVKSSTDIFNDVAIDAAMKFTFTPAYMNQGPVKVWVAFPFRFKLKDATPS
jgi:TonB family protein